MRPRRFSGFNFIRNAQSQKLTKNGKISKIGYFQRAVANREVHHHMIFSSPFIFLQSYKPKNQVLEIFDSSDVYILKIS